MCFCLCFFSVSHSVISYVATARSLNQQTDVLYYDMHEATRRRNCSLLEILTGQRQCVLTCSSDNSVRTRVTQRRVCCVQVPQQPASEHACQELVRRTEHVSNTNSVRLISARCAAAVRAARRSRPADGRRPTDGQYLTAAQRVIYGRLDTTRCDANTHARSPFRRLVCGLVWRRVSPYRPHRLNESSITTKILRTCWLPACVCQNNTRMMGDTTASWIVEFSDKIYNAFQKTSTCITSRITVSNNRFLMISPRQHPDEI